MHRQLWRLDIYTDVTKELAEREFDNLEEKLKENRCSSKAAQMKTLSDSQIVMPKSTV